MGTYVVMGTATLSADLEITVEADNEKEAIAAAEQVYELHFEEVVDTGDLDFDVYDVTELD